MEQPGQPSSCLHCRQRAQLCPVGQCCQRVRAQEVGGTSPSLPRALGGHSQPCCSSSSQTMRAIFSQCFNASQLASVLGSPPPLSPPRQRATRPAPPSPCSCHLCITAYLTVSAQPLPTPPDCNPVRRKPIRAQSKVQELTLETPDTGNTAAPSNTHTFPQWRRNPWTDRLTAPEAVFTATPGKQG